MELLNGQLLFEDVGCGRPESEGASVSDYRVRRRRGIRLLLTLVTGTSLLAASPAGADHSFTIPASENGCAVPLQVEAEHGADRVPIGYGDITFTNLETGATYLQRSRYTGTETYDPSTQSLHVTIKGRIWHAVFPGEPGPSGVVQEPGLELLLSGKVNVTFDENGVLTAFSLDGTYTDLCEKLSG